MTVTVEVGKRSTLMFRVIFFGAASLAFTGIASACVTSTDPERSAQESTERHIWLTKDADVIVKGIYTEAVRPCLEEKPCRGSIDTIALLKGALAPSYVIEDSVRPTCGRDYVKSGEVGIFYLTANKDGSYVIFDDIRSR